MNPVFWFLVILAAVILWFGLSILFSPLGRWLYRTMDDTREILNEVENDDGGEGEDVK
ncbi:MAG: hypothetical protein HFE61_05760 [Anaerotignum sp.]|jgi:hypothetical protein|nr:hypothetical protein [Anaerotignum sp.]